jgi:hypothetical protein
MVKKVHLKEEEHGSIELFDNDEKPLMSLALKPGLNEIDLYKVPLEAGIYIYKIIINQKVIETKNLVIIN